LGIATEIGSFPLAKVSK